jgi:hypothetical protein
MNKLFSLRKHLISATGETADQISTLLGHLDAAIDHGCPLTLPTVREWVEQIRTCNNAARTMAVCLPINQEDC